MLLKEVAKVQDRGFIRQPVRESQASEPADGFNFIQRFFHGRTTGVCSGSIKPDTNVGGNGCGVRGAREW